MLDKDLVGHGDKYIYVSIAVIIKYIEGKKKNLELSTNIEGYLK